MDKSPYENFTKNQIKEAFEIFDEDRKGRAKMKHLGTIVRALGRVPTHLNLQDLAQKVEDPTMSGYFRLESLLPPLTEVLMKDEWKSATREELIKAFSVMDLERTERINVNTIEKIFLENGASFEESELNKFLKNLSVDSPKEIKYKEYCDPLVAPRIFDIVESRRDIREKIVDDRYRLI